MSRFGELFAESAPLIRRQQHVRDTVPSHGGRWPVGVVLPPDAAASGALHELTLEALALAGPDHFGSGQAGAAHVTVRSLETYRAGIAADDPAISRYSLALARACGACAPVAFRLTGLTCTSSSILACAEPEDPAAQRFAERLAAELGHDGWREDGFRRDIWYVSLVHFTGYIDEPERLLEWIARRRHLTLGTTRAGEAELVRFVYDRSGAAPCMRPVVLSRVPFATLSH